MPTQFPALFQSTLKHRQASLHAIIHSINRAASTLAPPPAPTVRHCVTCDSFGRHSCASSSSPLLVSSWALAMHFSLFHSCLRAVAATQTTGHSCPVTTRATPATTAIHPTASPHAAATSRSQIKRSRSARQSSARQSRV